MHSLRPVPSTMTSYSSSMVKTEEVRRGRKKGGAGEWDGGGCGWRVRGERERGCDGG